MKIFRVVTQRDGEQSVEPGKRITEVEQIDRRYAAEYIQQVWDAIEPIRNSEEETLIAIIEEHPSVEVI